MTDLTPSLSALNDQRAAWVAAVRARDVEGYAALLTPDVVWFPPGQAALSGRLAFQAWVQPFFERFAYDFHLEDVRCQLAGSFARERGQFRTVMTPLGGGSPMQHRGEYLVLWRHNPAAGWQIERYVDLASPPS